MKNAIKIKTSKGLFPVFIDEILFLESESNRTFFKLDNGRHIKVAKTLSVYERILPAETFCRVHNSLLVNMDKIKFFDKYENVLVLSNNMELVISRRKLKPFVQTYFKKNTISAA